MCHQMEQDLWLLIFSYDNHFVNLWEILKNTLEKF